MRRFTFFVILMTFLNAQFSLAADVLPPPRPMDLNESVPSSNPAPAANDAPAVSPASAAEATNGPAAQAEQKIEQFKSGIASLQPDDVKTQLVTAADDCKSALSMAKNACLESLSPHIQSGMAILSAGMSALQAASGSKDSCSKSSDLMDAAQKAMTAYNGACGALKMMCNSKCAKSKTTASSAKASCTKATDPTQQAECQKKTAEGETTFGQGVAACNDFQKNLAAGVAALGGILGNLGKSKKCEKDAAASAVDCAANPSDPKCVATANLDCNKAENASHPRCICEKNPRMAGCAGANTVPTTEANVNPGTNSVKGDDGVGSLGSGGANDDTTGGGSSLGGGGGGGMPFGSGGGAGGGAGKGMSGTDGGGKKDGKPTNTNILSGEYGGGGGGRSGGGGGSDDGARYGKYAGYLPKNDRGLAGAKNDSPVTGGNGLTNWQKVNIRYKENKQTLLNGL